MITHRLRRSVTLLLALSLSVSLRYAARAESSDALSAIKPSTFGKSFTANTQQQLVVNVPLVALKDARVVMANHDELRRIGVAVPSNGLQSPAFEDELVRSFAFRPATPEEIAQGRYTHTGIATRYADKNGSTGVRGDGRAALTGEVVVRDRRGRVTGVFDLQVKGVGTGLHPNWNDHQHSHGKETLRQALEDAIFSDYLSRNGLQTNRWLAVIDTTQTINYPDGGKEQAGILVRGGNFLRLAHFNLVRNDPSALRELVDFAGRQLSIELGRSRPLSIAGLYKTLSQRKAVELAQNWWLRTVHGSTTYDNIGLMDNMDHGTTSTVDRTHPNFSFFSKWVGYGGEPAFVMHQYYETELFKMLRSVATPAERAALARIKPARMTAGMLEQQMTYQTLLHVGLSEKEAGRVMRKGRAAAHELYSVVASLSSVSQFGATHQMGKIQVKDPARFDVFAALNKLPELQVTRRTPEQRAQALVKVLRSGATADADDLDSARDLVAAYDRLVQPLFARVDRREIVGRVRLWREAAATRNFFAAGLVRSDLREFAGSIVGRIQNGEQLETVRADLGDFMRNNVTGGPGSSLDAAARVTAGTAMRAADRRLILSSYRENGVSIRELSDGRRDAIEVRLAGNPLDLGELGRYRMRFNTGGGWTGAPTDIAPLRLEGNEAVFEIPVASGSAPRAISAVFYDAEGKASRWWNNGGRNFGGSHRLVLSSANVQAALALEALRRGAERTGVRWTLQRVARSLFRAEQQRRSRPLAQPPAQLPRHQRALLRTSDRDGASAVRAFPLRPRRDVIQRPPGAANR